MVIPVVEESASEAIKTALRVSYCRYMKGWISSRCELLLERVFRIVRGSRLQVDATLDR